MDQTILDIIIRGKDEFSSVAKKTSSSMSGMQKAAVVAATASTAALVGFGVAAIKSAADYQTLTERIVTTGGEQQKYIKQVQDGLLQISSATGFSADEVAKAYYKASSAGYTYANGGLKVVKAATQAAAMEGGNAVDITDALTSVMRDYHKPANQAANVTSMLVEAVSRGKTTFPLFANSLHSVLSIASAAHVPLSDILADVSAMTVHGVSAEQATVDLAHGIQKMQNPTSIMTSELAQVGIKSSDLMGMLGKKGLAGTLQTISNAFYKNSKDGKLLISAFNNNKLEAEDATKAYSAMPAALQKVADSYLSGGMSMAAYRLNLQEMGGPQANLVKQYVAMANKAHGFSQILKSGQNPMQSYSQYLQKATGDSVTYTDALMLTGENTKYVNDANKAIAKSAADAHGNVMGWGDYQKTFNAQMKEAKSSIHNVVTGIGLGLLPGVTHVAKAIADVLKPVADWMTHNKKLAATIFTTITAIAGIVASLLLARAAVHKITEAWKVASKIVKVPWKIAKGGIRAFRKVFTKSLDIIKGAWKIAGKVVSKAWDLTKAIGSFIKMAAKGIWSAVVTAAQHVASAAVAAAAWVAANAVMLLGIGLVIAVVIGAVILIKKHWKSIEHFFSKLWKDILNFLKQHWRLILEIILGPIALIIGNWGVISRFFSKLWSDIVSGVGRFIKAVVKYFIELPGNILAALKTIGSWLLKAGKDLIGGLVGGIVGAGKDLWDGLTRSLSAIGRFVSGIGKWLWNAGINLVKGLASGIVGAAKDLWSGLSKGFAGIGHFFKDVGTWLFDAGKWLIQGFANGVKNFAHIATNAVKNVGSDVVKGFKSLLGIHSPSTVFAEAGKNIGQGLAIGITSTKGLVQSAANTLVNTPNGKVNLNGTVAAGSSVPAAAPSSSSAGTGGGFNMQVGSINVTIQGGYSGSLADQQKVATQMWQALMAYARMHNKAGNIPDLGVRPI